jgi:DNA polymerase III alpha subunit (gram-positive type)
MFNQELLREKKDQKYVVFDTETESLSLYHSRPFEIFWLVGQGNNILSEHHYYVGWNDINVSAGAALMTKFNLSAYQAKSTPAKTVLAEFNKYLYDPQYRIVGHNILKFDAYQHNTWARECGVKTDYSWLDRLIDTDCLSKAITMKIAPDRENFLAWLYKMAHFRKKGVKSNLGFTAKSYGIAVDENQLHAAGYDVKLNYSFFLKQLWDIEI